MNIILLGPQGSGKGTQAELAAKRFGLQHLEMGRIFRSIAESDHPKAAEIREVMDKGQLVPDELVRLIAWDFITKHDPKTNGFIFEGYPRTLPQYEQVKEMLKRFGKRLSRVFNIEISHEESIRRLSARRTCEKCGRVFNLITHPSKTGEMCEDCGGKLTQREDDTPEAIKRRLLIYDEQTRPVFNAADAEGIGMHLNGERSIEEIFTDIETELNKVKDKNG